MKETGAPKGRLITGLEVWSDEGVEDAADLSRGDDDGGFGYGLYSTARRRKCETGGAMWAAML